MAIYNDPEFKRHATGVKWEDPGTTEEVMAA